MSGSLPSSVLSTPQGTLKKSTKTWQAGVGGKGGRGAWQGTKSPGVSEQSDRGAQRLSVISPWDLPGSSQVGGERMSHLPSGSAFTLLRGGH